MTAGELEVVIRRCEAADLPALEWEGAFRHHRSIFEAAYRMQASGEALLLLAEAEGRAVGQAWLDLRPRPGSGRAMVWAVRVRPEWQGRGLGARLMAAIEAAAVELGHPRLELGVEKDNPGALAFYRRLGWRPAGARRETYAYVTPEGEPVSHVLEEWVLEKDLASEGGASPTRP